MNAKFEQLRTRLNEINDLKAALAVLGWDQQTYMPAGGAEARAMQMGTLSKTAHEWFVADEIGQLLEDLEPELESQDYGSFEASLVRVELEKNGNEILMKIEDDGIGFDHAKLNELSSLGLFGMRERAAAWGGDVRFEGGPGLGTTIIVQIPISGEGSR